MDTGPERAETVGRRRACTRPRSLFTPHKSGGQTVSDLLIQRLRGRVVGEAQHVATGKPSEPTRPGNEKEPERAHAAEEVGVRALAGSGLGLGEGLQLEVADQVVGEDAQL